MGSIASSLSGLSYLTETGGPLSNLPAPISTADLKSASPQDLVSISMAAIQAQAASELFGISQASQSTLPVLPVASQSATDVLPGVSSSDLANATPQQQAAMNNQALLLQQVQSLFGEPDSTAGTINALG
jgi:hypothetical protein